VDLGVRVDVAQANSEALIELTISLKPESAEDQRVFEATIEGRFRPLGDDDSPS
jgi:hypothetical protein